MRTSLFILLLTIALASCETVHTPKPKGYNRIDLPPHEYVDLKSDRPYHFQYNAAANEKEHNSYVAEAHWMDVYYPELDANIEITYKKLSDSIRLDDLVNDVFRLAHGHDKKAYAIDQTVVNTQGGLTGLIFELQGEVPSQYQFAVTDSTDNFLRAALYFKTSTKNDSLAPVINYIKEDMLKMMNSASFKN